MSFVINPYRFGGGAPPAGVPTPLHWFDLDDEGTWSNDGTSSAISLGAVGTPTTTTSTVGSTNRTVCNLDRGDRFQDLTVAWDGANNDQMSVSIWFKYDTLPATALYLLDWRDAGGEDVFYKGLFSTLYSTIGGQIFDDAGANNVLYYQDIAANDTTSDTWYHSCFRYSGGTVNHYVNNVLQNTDTNVSMGDFDLDSSKFYISGIHNEPTSASYQHDGLIGMIGIFDEDIGVDGVAHLYNAGEGRNYSELTIV